jgi:hypothetical protein
MADGFDRLFPLTEVTSMMRNVFGLFGLFLALGPALLAETRQPAKPTQPSPPTGSASELPPFSKFSKTPDIIQRLQTVIDTKDFRDPDRFKEALEALHDALVSKKNEVPLFFDEEAFKAEMPKKIESFDIKVPVPPTKEPSILDFKVQLPSLPKKMTAEAALRALIGQLPKVKATYLIRNGTVVITTAKQASIKSLLQEKVAASFYQKPLFEALFALSDQTGASIAIDPKVTERAFVPVSATFAHDTTLESALSLLTDMAGLRHVIIGDGIYVTTVENADKLRYMPKY